MAAAVPWLVLSLAALLLVLLLLWRYQVAAIQARRRRRGRRLFDYLERHEPGGSTRLAGTR